MANRKKVHRTREGFENFTDTEWLAWQDDKLASGTWASAYAGLHEDHKKACTFALVRQVEWHTKEVPQ